MMKLPSLEPFFPRGLIQVNHGRLHAIAMRDNNEMIHNCCRVMDESKTSRKTVASVDCFHPNNLAEGISNDASSVCCSCGNK